MAKMIQEELKFELFGIAIITFALLGLISLFTPAVGTAGQFLNQCLSTAAGEGRYLLPLLLIWLGTKIMRERSNVQLIPQFLGVALMVLIILSFMHLSVPFADVFQAGQKGEGGGLLGAAGSYLLLKYFDLAGSYIILTSLMIASIILATSLSLSHLSNAIARTFYSIGQRLFNGISRFIFEELPEEKKDKAPKTAAKTLIINNNRGTSVSIQPSTSRNSQTNGQTEIVKRRGLAKNTPEKSGNETDEAFSHSLALTGGKTYLLPPSTILSWVKTKEHGVKDKEINEKIRILEETLASFGINARVTQVTVGPAITRYEIQPPAGVKVSRIVGLVDDITLAMAASHVRIEAPIPGRAAIGIEIPNREISTVHLRELIESKEFSQAPSNLTVALGKDIAGTPVVTDLAQMPHLLIAGATGSGKSVCINTLVASILFKSIPDEVKFILIDPKMVELTTYNGIPHLITPVVTNPKKASGILHWAVKEMEQRYELFAAAGVRDITRYNKIHSKKTLISQEFLTDPPEIAETANNDGPLPFIVLIIDELADLMMISPAEVEDSICRLAQMARAAGIHLVVATQRPSVDVITGLIKANIPSRISFAVSSQMDSRTILDMGGAEKLLGRGDMLFFPVGAPKPVRIQGAFLSDKEVETLVNFLKEQAKPVYNEQMVEVLNSENNLLNGQEDDLLPQAAQLFIEQGNASVSLLQRRFHIGYARAARLVDIMEQRGIVGRFEGSKPRSILMTWEQFRQAFKHT